MGPRRSGGGVRSRDLQPARAGRSAIVSGITVVDPRGASVPVWRSYVELTKPRIIELLLVTTVPAMFVATGGWPDWWLVLATLIGGTLSAGGANAINNAIDHDIDQLMRRTSRRPVPTDRVNSRQAL
ncbi:MAG: UbiA family prenyltransferase, partial [Acidimicrobiia bacterium]|nr:UbiA family prenyltransferase [Acidimicrobiia bacterium]